MILYADTSLLISYYLNDSNSVSAQAILQRATDPLPFTGLHRLEMSNALALGVFRRILTSAQASTAWSDVGRDLRSGRLVAQPVNWIPVAKLVHSPQLTVHSRILKTSSQFTVHSNNQERPGC